MPRGHHHVRLTDGGAMQARGIARQNLVLNKFVR